MFCTGAVCGTLTATALRGPAAPVAAGIACPFLASTLGANARFSYMLLLSAIDLRLPKSMAGSVDEAIDSGRRSCSMDVFAFSRRGPTSIRFPPPCAAPGVICGPPRRQARRQTEPSRGTHHAHPHHGELRAPSMPNVRPAAYYHHPRQCFFPRGMLVRQSCFLPGSSLFLFLAEHHGTIPIMLPIPAPASALCHSKRLDMSTKRVLPSRTLSRAHTARCRRTAQISRTGSYGYITAGISPRRHGMARGTVVFVHGPPSCVS